MAACGCVVLPPDVHHTPAKDVVEGKCCRRGPIQHEGDGCRALDRIREDAQSRFRIPSGGQLTGVLYRNRHAGGRKDRLYGARQIREGRIPVDRDLVRRVAANVVDVRGGGDGGGICRAIAPVLSPRIRAANDQARYGRRDLVAGRLPVVRLHWGLVAVAGDEGVAGGVPSEEVVEVRKGCIEESPFPREAIRLEEDDALVGGVRVAAPVELAGGGAHNDAVSRAVFVTNEPVGAVEDPSTDFAYVHDGSNGVRVVGERENAHRADVGPAGGG